MSKRYVKKVCQKWYVDDDGNDDDDEGNDDDDGRQQVNCQQL